MVRPFREAGGDMILFRSERVPVFILGCQRSGTTICQNVFLNARDIAVYREGNKEAMTDNWRLREPSIIRDLITNSRRQVHLFKPINDSQWGDRFLSEFDNARVVWIYRDVFDTANSAVAKWGNSQRQMIEWIAEGLARHSDRQEALEAIGARPNTAIYAERLDDEAVRNLVEWSGAGLSDHAGAAVLWWLRNRLYFSLAFDTNSRVLLLRYADFVADPQKEIRRLCQFIGVRYSRRLAGSVHAGSVRKSPPPQLPGPILAACSDLAARLDAATQDRNC